MYGRWIYYHIMEININAQFQPACRAENDHFVNHKSFAHHSFSKLKIITKWLPAVSMAFSPVHRLLEEMLLLLCCSMLWAAMGSVRLFLRNQWSRQKPSSTRLPAFCGPLFTPCKNLKSKETTKKITQKKKKKKTPWNWNHEFASTTKWNIFTIFTAYFFVGRKTILKPTQRSPMGIPRLQQEAALQAILQATWIRTTALIHTCFVSSLPILGV